MATWAIVAWLLGAPGLVLGLTAAAVRPTRPRFLREAWVYGLALGLMPGLVLSYIFWRDSTGSSSPTLEAFALAAVPFPTFTNGVAGAVAAIKVREHLFGTTAV